MLKYNYYFVVFFLIILFLGVGAQSFGDVYTKYLLDKNGVAIAGIVKSEFSPDYQFGNLRNFVVYTSAYRAYLYRSSDNASPLSNSNITSSKGFAENSNIQAISVFLVDDSSYVFSDLNYMQLVQGASYLQTFSATANSNTVIKWAVGTASGTYNTILTYFSGSNNMTIRQFPWKYDSIYRAYSQSGTVLPTPTNITADTAINFMVTESSAAVNEAYVGVGQTVYRYSLIDKDLKSTFTLSNAASKTALVSNGTLYTCTTSSLGGFIEAINVSTGLSSVHALHTDISYCLSMNLDLINKQLFVSVADNSGNLAIVTITTSGTSPLMKKITPSEAVSTGSLTSYSYGVGVDAVLSIVSIASSSEGKIYSMSYVGYCNCSGHGNCSAGVCMCNSGWGGSDCSLGKPTISTTGTTRPAFIGATDITINGTNFVNTTNYAISICGSSCTSMVYGSNTSISCTLTLDGTQSTAPTSQCSYTVTFDSYSSDSVLISYAQPVFNSNYQTNNTIVVSGENFYSSSYLSCYLNDNLIDCTSTGSLITIIIPSGTVTASIKINNKAGQTLYLPQLIRLAPYLISLNSTVIDTAAGVGILVTGDFFQSNSRTNLKVYFGSTSVTGTVISMTKLSFNMPQGIVANQTVYLYDETLKISSNLLSFKYNAPTIVSITQDKVTSDIVSITGTNFGSYSSVINQSQIASYSFINDTLIVATLESTASSGSYSIYFVTEPATSGFTLNLQPVITSVSKPAVTGGNITLVGDYLRNTSIIYLNPYDGNTEQTLSCNAESGENHPATLICTIPSSAGVFKIYSRTLAASTLVAEKSDSYQVPTITDISPKIYFENDLTRFTITGDSFKPIDFTIQINGENCSAVQTNTKSVICDIQSTVPANSTTNPVPVVVTVAGQSTSSNSTVSYYYKQCSEDCGTNGQCNYSTGQCEDLSSSTKHSFNMFIIMLLSILVIGL